MRIETRYLERAIEKDALVSNKMAFISGPRQVGKTTMAKQLLEDPANYFTWDDKTFRRRWAKDPLTAVSPVGPGPILLDEIHRDKYWKRSLKGIYDQAAEPLQLIVSGSARLDLYRRGGESLLGRYFPYRLHPFSVAEKDSSLPFPDQLTAAKANYPLQDIIKLSGFPEPLLTASRLKAERWARLRKERILQQDLRDLRAVYNIRQLDLCLDLIAPRVGNPLSLNSLKQDLDVAYATVREWIELFHALYLTFPLLPYNRGISRSLKLEKKIYLFEPLDIDDSGAALENTIALHLLKACHYWTDTAQGNFKLHYIRTKDKEEVDFCVIRDKRPWLLLESKSSQLTPTPALRRFTALLKPTYSFQTVTKKNYDKKDIKTGIRVINAEKFLSMLI